MLQAVLLHVSGWLLFLSLPAFFNPRMQQWSVSAVAADMLIPPRLANGLLLVLVFYIQYYGAIPRLYLGKKYVLYGANLFLCLLVLLGINAVMQPPEFRHRPEPVLYGFHLFMFLMVLIVPFPLRLYQQWQESRRQHLAAESALLKSQLNPHFLFNALNSIYALALRADPRTPDAILQLSGLARYAIGEAALEKVPLGVEVAQLRDYLSFQQLRLSTNMHVVTDVEIHDESVLLPPLLLLPFVENAFKYGVTAGREATIRLSLRGNGQQLHFSVLNEKCIDARTPQGLGKGIAIARRRLELAFPGRHRFHIADEPLTFRVTLDIQFA